jgi:hypothetical protein
MYYLSCDVCKKMIEDPKSGKTYYTMKSSHICRKCMLAMKRDFQDRCEADSKPYDFLARKEEFAAVVARKTGK